jgi:sulfite reductase beta subunit-like hemoprotein
MAAVDDPRTLGRARLSFADEAEADEFVATLAQFERGEIGPDAWRAFRLTRGTYGQRQDADAQMLRVKVPQGVLDSGQLRALADVAERWSRGFGHVTTRQNIQFHFLRLHDVEAAMKRLAAEGLTTREACGNSVRNITCCPFAGVSRDEVFDPTPYAEALTRHLLRHPLSSSLPRKFKIALEGCAEDHAFTAVNDIGFQARLDGAGDGQRGFRVTIGGGTATKCTSGQLLHAFAPAGEILEIAEALVRVFHRLGDREHRHRNRLKFLIAQLGWDGFLAAYARAREEVRAEGAPRLPFDAERPRAEGAPEGRRPPPPSPEAVAASVSATAARGPGMPPEVRPVPAPDPEAYGRWLRTNVRAQKQTGFSSALVTLPLGDFTGGQARALADLIEAYGDGQARTTHGQNLLLRWVRADELEPLYQRLSAAGLGWADAGTVADVTSCPGAESCRLAVTQSRGLGRAAGELLRSRPDLVALAPDLQLRVSGCPNGCGLHHVAGIGFQGSVRKVGGKAVPQYFVQIGGGVTASGATFGRLAAKIPARRVPEAVERLIQLSARERREGESATEFFRRVEPSAVKALLEDLERLTPETATPDDFHDLGETGEFVPATKEGECAS